MVMHKIKRVLRESSKTCQLIHKKLKESHPRSVKNAKKIFWLKYPKLILFVSMIILAYFLFRSPSFSSFISNLGSWNYFGTFIAGLFFSFGFTTPFAIAFFLALNPENLFLASILGGAGAMISDFAIFKIVKFSMMDEFEKIEKEMHLEKIKKIIKKDFNIKFVHYFLYLIAGIIIASPLPDEIGVSMLAGLSSIKAKMLIILSFIFNSLGIFLILLV